MYWAAVSPVDVPFGWNPRANKSPTGAFVTAFHAAALFESLWAQKKSWKRMFPALFGGVPRGTRTLGLQIHNLAR